MPQKNLNPYIPGPGGTSMPVAIGPVRDNRRGMLWMFVSVFGASVMTLSVRMLTEDMDPRVIVLLRASITAALMLPAILLIPRVRAHMRFSKPWAHVLRGACIGAATHFGFYTIATVPLATATVLMFTAPIFATLLGIFVHGEKVGLRRIAAILVGFVGALIILRPGFSPLELGMLTALLSSLTFAIALSMSRNMAEADGPLSMYFSSVVATVLISIPLALPVWQVPDTRLGWGVLLVLVLMGTLRSIADIQAYRQAEAAVLAPIAYLRLVIIGTAAFFLFSEIPDNATLIGATIIMGSTLYVARREAVLSKAGKS